jgi:hypothetical protein
MANVLDENYEYKASEWGQRYHNLDLREALGAGSAGPGKSLVLLMDPIPRVLIEHWRCLGEVTDPNAPPYMHTLVKRYPLKWGDSAGWALHLRRAFPMLEQTIARSKKLFPKIDPAARWNEPKHIWTFKSGYRYQFGHCLHNDDWMQYDSNQYDWIGYDELIQFDEEQYHNINSRLRSGDPVLMHQLRIRSMSNPVRRKEGKINIDVKDPQWVRRRFVEPCIEGGKILRKTLIRRNGEKVNRDRIFLRATLYDNPDPDFIKQYEEELLDKPPHIRQAMLYGNWFVTSGSYYGEDWIDNLHVVKPYRIPSDYKIWRTMDWGFKTWGCVEWMAMDYDENVIVFKELSFRNKDVNEVSKDIKRIEQDLGLWTGDRSGITGPADTQLWEERGEGGLSKADMFQKNGISWMQANKKSRVSNAGKFLMRLKDHGGGTRTPGIVFFNTCERAIATIPGIQLDGDNPEAPAKGGDDHWHDAVLYGCAFASHGLAGIPSRRKTKPTFQEQAPSIVNNGSGRSRWGYGV